MECGQGTASRFLHAKSEHFDSEDSPICSLPVRREICTLQELARMAQSHIESEE